MTPEDLADAAGFNDQRRRHWLSLSRDFWAGLPDCKGWTLFGMKGDDIMPRARRRWKREVLAMFPDLERFTVAAPNWIPPDQPSSYFNTAPRDAGGMVDAQAVARAMQEGWLAINDVRRQFGFPPIEDNS